MINRSKCLAVNELAILYLIAIPKKVKKKKNLYYPFFIESSNHDVGQQSLKRQGPHAI